MTLGGGLEYNARKQKPTIAKIIETDIDSLEIWAVKKPRMTFDRRKCHSVPLNRNNQLNKIQDKLAQ